MGSLFGWQFGSPGVVPGWGVWECRESGLLASVGFGGLIPGRLCWWSWREAGAWTPMSVMPSTTCFLPPLPGATSGRLGAKN